MPPVLALYEDVLSDGAALALPAAARMIFLVHGGATIAGRALRDGEAWHGEGAAIIGMCDVQCSAPGFAVGAKSATPSCAGLTRASIFLARKSCED